MRPYQIEWMESIMTHRYTAILACRQVGKSWTMALAAITLAFAGDPVIIISETQAKANNIIKLIKSHCEAIEKITNHKIIHSSSIQRIQIKNNSNEVISIESRPGTATSVQSYTGHVFLDEMSTNKFDPEQILGQILSVTSSSPNFKVVICSNSSHMGSFVQRFFRPTEVEDSERFKGFNKFELTIHEAYPNGLPKQIRQIQEIVSETFWRQFFLNEFISSGVPRFELDLWEKRTKQMKPQHVRYILGIDPGWTRNPTGLCLIKLGENETTDVILAEGVYKPQLENLIKKIKEINQKYPLSKIVMDQGMAHDLKSRLISEFGESRIIPISINQKFYNENSDRLEYLIQNEKIWIPKDFKLLREEIQMVYTENSNVKLPERRTQMNSPNLKDTIDHCDRFCALLLAITEVKTISVISEFKHSKNNTIPKFIKGFR